MILFYVSQLILWIEIFLLLDIAFRQEYCLVFQLWHRIRQAFRGKFMIVEKTKYLRKEECLGCYSDYPFDVITLLEPEEYVSPFERDLVLLHEVGHWTGSKIRLNRPSYNSKELDVGGQNLGKYLFEEAVANHVMKRLTKHFFGIRVKTPHTTIILENIRKIYYRTGNENDLIRLYRCLIQHTKYATMCILDDTELREELRSKLISKEELVG